MGLNLILFIVVAVLVIGGILFRYLVYDRMKGHSHSKKLDGGEIQGKG